VIDELERETRDIDVAVSMHYARTLAEALSKMLRIAASTSEVFRTL
jgi:hypothetical protein